MNYSFALEYDGPPLPYSIPRAIPLDLSHIPMASPAPPSSTSSLPVVHPLPSPLLPAKPAASTFSPTSVIETAAVMDRSAELTEDAAETSGPVGRSQRVSVESNSEFDDFRSRSSGSDQEEEEEDDDDEEDFMDGDGGDFLPYKRPPVTFRDSPSLETSVPRRSTKKGTCYHCGKGSRFTEKESCLACGAKYCGDCLIRAMGSMPEGRKCITCIGRPILESKRDRIGKASKILKKMFSSREVKQVMREEKCCEANQLRPEDVFVNGKKLSLDELALLQTCPCPPPKLKPGYYWYDKVSGYWGKIGHKPSKIITPNLNVGGNLEKNASNGNTGICINGREITKSELQMLKLAGVQCAGKPQFWVNADGSYQEEGQKKIIGRIWGKPIVKLLCPVLSLPTPSSALHPNVSDKEYVESAKRGMPNYVENKPAQKMLLVGCDGSGTSTIFKQAKILYKNTTFTEEECEEMKIMIQTNVYRYLAILLEGREIFEEEIMNKKAQTSQLSSSDTDHLTQEVTEYALGPRLSAFADWLLKVMASGSLEVVFPAATREYAPRVEELWKDPAIQATFKRKDELQMLPSCASYFLDKVGDVCRMDYEPNNSDILNAAGLTSSNGVACTDFIFPRLPYDTRITDDLDHQESPLKYELIRIHSKGLAKNGKWLDMFEEVRIVIFCVAMSDYDEFYEGPDGLQINKMLESRDLFEKIITSDAFAETSFLLILNKTDLLEKKIDHSPLTVCDWFSDFHPLKSNRASYSSRNLSNHSTLGQTAGHYIAVKFKRLFSSLVGGPGRRLYVTCTNALDSNSVDSALRYAKEVLRWDDERQPVFEADSIYSVTEPSTYSC